MMFMRKLALAAMALGLAVVFFGTALAQNPQPTQPQSTTDNSAGKQQPGGFGRGEGRRGPGPGMRPGLFNRRIQSELNLTDDQKKQLQSIFRQSFEGTKAQREQMEQLAQKRSQGTLSADDEAREKTLHQQMRASMRETEAKAESVLTPDQKAKLDQLRKQREADHGGFNRRGDFKNRPNQVTPPTTPPVQP
jgi:Spy/CpxP family protein refolding chaperone